MRPMIVVFTGLPGTGKSTLSESLGRRVGAPVFSGDWLLGSMQPAHEQLAHLDQTAYSQLYESVLAGLLTRQVMLGQSAIVDCVFDDDAIGRCARIAHDHDASLSVVECLCSDESVHRARMKGRVRGIPGWHEVDWNHVERMRSQVGALSSDRLVVDAVQPLRHNEAEVWAYLAGRR